MISEDAGASFVERFRSRLAILRAGHEPARLLVAVSGGCDSMVLLHLLRFHTAGLPLELTVAHLDHAMRPGSGADLLWLRGICEAWGLPLRSDRLPRPPAGETEARTARYAFLRSVADGLGSDHLILTAHQADDQAETVLFRILRGTGLRGLRGIRERTPDGVVRPLLPFWRSEIEAYARASGLRWRSDESNRVSGPARNRIRLRVLPDVEASFAPGARRHLVALAEHAAEADRALDRLVEDLEREAVTRDGSSYLLARSKLRQYDPATVSRLLRRLLRRFDVVLGRAGTRSALQFITHASSGRELPLPRGLHLLVEFDVVRLEPIAERSADLELEVPEPPVSGGWQGRARLAGADYDVSAQRLSSPPTGVARESWTASLPLAELRFPLEIRGWRSGDRVRTAGGTKTLKKLFLELRVPRSLRHRLPVVTDLGGTILWVGGLARSFVSPPAAGEETLLLKIMND